MSFEVRIKNLGKLDDALIRVSPLTVLTGQNNTGKTFFSKVLYSIFDALNTNYIAEEFHHRAAPLRGEMYLPLRQLEEIRKQERGEQSNKSSVSNYSVMDMLLKVDQMEMVASLCSIRIERSGRASFIPKQEYPELKKEADEFLKIYESLSPDIDVFGERIFGSEAETKKYAEDLRKVINHICDIDKMDISDLVASVFKRQTAKNILCNFQVESMEILRGKESDIEISIGEDIIFHVNEKGIIDSPKIPISTLMAMQRLSKAIYLESPALWKIKVALQKVKMFHPRNRRSEDLLLGVPDYFYDIASALQEKSIGENDFPDILKYLTEDVLRGSISLSDNTMELMFNEDGRGAYPLSATSIGVANLGMLAMLIERKVLDKEAFLFIDEPESNLHPAWQVEMTETLWKLVSAGVRVVVATHSVDILKRLEIYGKEEEEKAKELITINHFQGDGKVEIGGVEKILDVKKDLSAPYFELYKRGFQ